MAQARNRPKKKTRTRSDPARRAEAARREEARRLAAEERRRAEQAVERRRKALKTARKVGIPLVVAAVVIVGAIYAFRPQREIPNAQVTTIEQSAAELGYDLPAEIDTGSLPAPVCGVLTEPISSGELLFSDLYNGAVILWHRPDDQEAADFLAGVAGGFPSHVVVSPTPELAEGTRMLAMSATRQKAYEPGDDEVREFVDAYQRRTRGHADCEVAGSS